MLAKKNSVLLLNSDYTFLNTIDTKKFMSLLIRDKINILKSNENKLHFSLNINHPEVVIFKDYIRIPYNTQNVKLSRESIMIRDNFQCQYSGKKLKKSEIEIDHVIPRSRGGKDTWENLVCTSKKINNLKGNKTPEEAGLKLLRTPFKPKISDLMSSAKREIWSEYLNY